MTLTATRRFVFKRTDQLSAREQAQFTELFGRVFGQELSREQFERKYLCTPLGHSHHGLMVVEDRIVGAYNLVPYLYECFGTRRLFGLSVDAMVDEEHRSGPFNLLKLARLVYREAVREDVVFAFGFPNDQAYEFTKKVLRWKTLGELDFYALPIRIGALRDSLRWINPLSRLCAAGWVHLPRPLKAGSAGVRIEKVCDAAFRRHRYDERHSVVRLKHGGECTYRIYEEEGGARALYLIDVTPLTADRFAEAVRVLHGIAASSADVMLYVGRLPFRPKGLLRVPPARWPRHIRMCGKVLDPERVDDRILQIENWNVNISNFDVR